MEIVTVNMVGSMYQSQYDQITEIIKLIEGAHTDHYDSQSFMRVLKETGIKYWIWVQLRLTYINPEKKVFAIEKISG